MYSILTGFFTLASAFGDPVKGRKQATFGAIFLKFKDGLYDPLQADVLLMRQAAIPICRFNRLKYWSRVT